MIRDTRLSTKLALGFGALVVVAAIVGYTGWSGIQGVEEKVETFEQGNECLARMNDCATLRRDFAIKGFAKAEGEEKDSSERWKDASAALLAGLDAMANATNTSDACKAAAVSASESTRAYAGYFEEQVKMRKQRDEAVASWGTVGASITQDIGKATDEVIKPAMDVARQNQNLEEFARWSDISNGLENSVVKPFLLLRVMAVYLIAENTEARYEAYAKQLDTLRSGLSAWSETVQGEERLKSAATQITSFLDEYAKAGNLFHESMVKNVAIGKELGTSAAAVVKDIATLQSTLRSEMNTIMARTNMLALGLTAGAIVLGIILALVITRAITKPISRVIEGLTLGASQVTAAANQVAESSQVMAEGASEQASSLEETSASLEEMSSMTKQNADNAAQANTMAKEATGACQRGRDEMKRMSEAIARIKESSDQTAKIIKTIDEIAFQTNLLALNAAVEAARAGEAGKGFAVVAEEVRNLAQRSAEAAKNTSALIEESQENSDNGVAVSEEVGKVLTQIAETVGKVTQLVGEVSSASNEQAQGIDQINTAVAQMDKVTQGNAAASEESASASEELSAQAEDLNGMIRTLVQIVGGKNAQMESVGRAASSGPARKPIAHRQPVARKAKANRSLALTASAKQANAVVSPETVIPLDDSDLKDF